MNTPRELFQKRKGRVRSALKKAANGKMRLSVFRSNMHVYAQIIDDEAGVTLCAASSNEKSFTEYGGNCEAAKKVGLALAERAKAKGISDVVFDRSGYVYHGRVAALADGAREGGLNF